MNGWNGAGGPAGIPRQPAPQRDTRARMPSSGPTFHAVPFDEIQLSTARSYLIKGLIPREGLVVVWGPPGCGKSFFVYDIVMHIALGWEYRTRRAAQGTVVYVACEGENGLRARTQAFRSTKMTEDTTGTPFWLCTTKLDLVSQYQELISDLTNQISDTLPAAVVIDTVNRSLYGSENKDEDMSAYIRAADAIRETFHCAVILIHHSGVDATRPRGHTSLAGAADTIIKIARDPESGTITASVEKMKDGEDGQSIASRLRVVELGQDEDGEEMTSCVIEDAEAQAPKAKKERPLSPKLKACLERLHDCIRDTGEPLPATRDAPSGQLACSLELWRQTLIKHGHIDPEAKNPRKDWQRIHDDLRGKGHIGIVNNRVWTVNKPFV